MATYDSFGVRLAASTIPYEDGSEDEVLSTLLRTIDRSDGSDELAIRIRDWPTRYHFSPLRTNLLRPIRIEPGLRVLDVGCGTGTITRWLGEQGATVIGLEGNIARARSAAVRCAGLPNVEIVAGTIEDLERDELFDLVVVIGVLEYSPVFLKNPDGPRQFMRSLHEHLADGAALVLAIENQLGLKYLLGFGEDHRGVPWVGLEGYARGDGPRTWNRRTLKEILRDCGFTEQRWLFPFPDYKLPSVILAERLYEHPAGREAIDHLLRTPVTSDASSPSLICDARLAHRQMLDAGLGPDVANSFLVLASSSPEPCNRLIGPELAWLYSTGRRRQWRRERAVLLQSGDLHIEDRSDREQLRTLAWLAQNVDGDRPRPFVSGEPLDLVLSAAIRKGDVETVGDLLRLWRSQLETRAEIAVGSKSAHPFDPICETDPCLPAEYLDVGVANFILHEGTLDFIDPEWVASGPVSALLVEVRALWWLSLSIVDAGEHHPWGPLASVNEICGSLCALAGLECPPTLLDRWRRAEAELQHLVHVDDLEKVQQALQAAGQRRIVDVSPRVLPFTALRGEIEAGRGDVQRLQTTVEGLRESLGAHQHQAQQQQHRADELQLIVGDLQGTVAAIRTENEVLRDRAGTAEALLESAQLHLHDLRERHTAAEAAASGLRDEVQGLTEDLKRWEMRFAALERRVPVRIYRRVQRVLRQGR